MDSYRKLVYKEKMSLNEFEINKDGSLNQLLYDEWLLTRKELRGDNKKILKVFNDAYYLCTLAFVKSYNKLNISYAVKRVDAQSVVLPLTRYYLSCIDNLPRITKQFWKSIESVMENDWIQNYNDLEAAVGYNKKKLIPDMFLPRIITKDHLSTLSEIDWRNITHDYNKQRIQLIAEIISKDKEEWRMIIEAIKAAAHKYDYDFGFEDYIEEGIDIDGPYTRTLKVPKNPYDSFGNEILEPLKRAGVYQFCDDLIDKYDELAPKTQPMELLMDSITEPIADIGNKKTFKHVNNYVKERVKRSIKECTGKKARLALLERTLYDHGQLEDINSHLPFLRQLVDWGMLPNISNADNPDEELKKTVNSIRDKARKLPEEGYKNWTKRTSDKLVCEKIGRILGKTMPYNRS